MVLDDPPLNLLAMALLFVEEQMSFVQLSMDAIT